jgi:hypothetical protein
MAVRVTVQATDAFKYCKLRFYWVLQEPCHSRPFIQRDVGAVVVLHLGMTSPLAVGRVAERGTDAPYCKLRFQWLCCRKDPAKSHTIQDLFAL